MLDFLREIFSFIYLKIMVPLAILAMIYVLLVYCVNMIWGEKDEEIKPEIKFRRMVATIFPFLVSLFAVMLSDTVNLLPKYILGFHFLWFLLAGGLVGYAFLAWINAMDKSEELFATLSCLVASTILFSVMTAFVVTGSFQILSFVFGFLFGTCVYIVVNGFSNVKAIKPVRFQPVPVINGFRNLPDKFPWKRKDRKGRGKEGGAQPQESSRSERGDTFLADD